jgi:hypothetical protein
MLWISQGRQPSPHAKLAARLSGDEIDFFANAADYAHL